MSEVPAGNQSTKSIKDTLSSQMSKEEEAHKKFLCLVAGENCVKEDFTGQGGRTLNIPKNPIPGKVPGPTYNGAITIGRKCTGDHCSVPVSREVFNEVSLRSNREIPFHSPSLYRPGNNTVNVPLKKYTNTGLNKGPFNIDVQR